MTKTQAESRIYEILFELWNDAELWPSSIDLSPDLGVKIHFEERGVGAEPLPAKSPERSAATRPATLQTSL
ncbi:MAG: hypothetical protein HQL50_12310 [Magnetococcales bacterium]|nr:hypothetical protein [Magnetococcales bacterium]